jgi:hypothetical protein
MMEFGGWDMPLNFPDGILAEHRATRSYGGIARPGRPFTPEIDSSAT